MNFQDILKGIEQNRKNHELGYYNCIPFMGLNRLERLIPGIEHGTYYLLTASTGVGKSKLGRYLFIHNPILYLEAEDCPEDVKVDILYFSLEESKRKIILSEISKYLYTRYNLVISIKELQSVGRYNTITADVLEKIKEAEEFVQSFMEKVKVVDNIRNPTGIYKYVRDFALQIGTYYDKTGQPLTKEEVEQVRTATGDAYKKVSYYKKHNPKHYVIVIVDHYGLFENESGMTQWQTIGKWSSDYCLHIRDKFDFTVVGVQQQAADKERVEHNFRGDTIESKLEPSLDGLGDNKTTSRDANIVLGLFNPDRYNIEAHDGYDINRFRDRYRSMHILKDRDGSANKRVPLFFNGAVDFFRELPEIEDSIGMNKVYEYINQLNSNNRRRWQMQ